MILGHIKGLGELKSLPPEELKKLSQEIREFLIEKINHIDGHLTSNLGVVELAITLHLAFSLLEDKVIWDIGHQSYTYKILTGRMAKFDELRQYGGLSGFPECKGSPYDSFDIGHNSTSVPASLGIALGRDLKGLDYKVVSVIGGGTLIGGMAYEALDDAARMKRNSIILLNDNNISISESVGGIPRYLNSLRTGSGYNDLKKSVAGALDRMPVVGSVMIDKIKRTKNGIKQLFIPGILFGNMGITYLGPVDRHNIPALCKVLREAQKLNHAVLVHVITKEGKGYRPAGRNPSHFHGVGPSDVDTGKPSSEQKNPSYTDVFSRKICQLGKQYPNLVAVTVAMPDGTGLTAFGKKYPHRFFSVGVAETHTVTSAAGMAAAGLKPVVAVYFSFLQRAHDQILHGVCIQNLPILFTVDRTGLVGSDGETHQGISSYSFLTSIPDVSVMAPKNMWELRVMLKFAMEYDRPLAVRYPRGETYRGLGDFRQSVAYGKGEMLYEKKDITLLAVGSMVSTGEHVREKLKEEGYVYSLVNGHFVRPIDIGLVGRLAGNHDLVITLEEDVLQGGYRLAVTAYIHQSYPHIKMLDVAPPDNYVEHGNIPILREGLGMDSDSIIRTMKAGRWMSELN